MEGIPSPSSKLVSRARKRPLYKRAGRGGGSGEGGHGGNFLSVRGKERASEDSERGSMMGTMAQETRETVPSPPNEEVVRSTPATAAHGIEIAVEFKPVEHPIEPVDHDQPIICPLAEPSILNDGRIWKERMSSASARVRSDLPVVKEGSQLEAEAGGKTKSPSVPPKRGILPSFSAPEHNILNLLEECSAAGDQSASC